MVFIISSKERGFLDWEEDKKVFSILELYFGFYFLEVNKWFLWIV